jgi:hypothetical protein
VNIRKPLAALCILALSFFFSAACSKKANPPHIDERGSQGYLAGVNGTEVEKVEQLAGYRLLKKHFFVNGGSGIYIFEMESILDQTLPIRIVYVSEDIYCMRESKEGAEFRIPFFVQDIRLLDGYTIIAKWAEDKETPIMSTLGEKNYFLKLKKGNDTSEVQVKKLTYDQVEVGDTFPLPIEKPERK